MDRRASFNGILIQDNDPRRFPKKPLNCTTRLSELTCADGHARSPICDASTSQSAQAGQGIGGNTPVVNQDANGDKDVCTGNTLRCPAGFTLFARKGQDLCWDSAANKDTYQY